MADLSEVAADVKQLKHDVHTQGNILKLMMFSQAAEFANSAVEGLVGDRVQLEIFRRVDGARSRDELIAAVVGLTLQGGKRASVYSKLGHLEDLGLIEPVPGKGRSNIYKKSAIADGLRIEGHPDYVKALKQLPKLPS